MPTLVAGLFDKEASMRCSSCDCPLPDGAAYCVECGAPVAATGRNVALDDARAPVHVPPAPDLPVPAAAASSRGRRRRSSLGGTWRPTARALIARSGAIFLIGLGILFFTDSFWPWILALVGVTGALELFAGGAVREGAMSLIMLVGLAVLFATGLFWPGILILVGLVAVFAVTPS